MSDLMEQLAAIEHDRWADWMRHMKMKSPGWVIRMEDIDRWERQMRTPYAELSESEKESDREQVRRYLPLFEPRIQQLKSDATALADALEQIRETQEGSALAIVYQHSDIIKRHRSA